MHSVACGYWIVIFQRFNVPEPEGKFFIEEFSVQKLLNIINSAKSPDDGMRWSRNSFWKSISFLFAYAIESNLVKNEDENLCVFNIGTPQTQLIELPAC